MRPCPTWTARTCNNKSLIKCVISFFTLGRIVECQVVFWVFECELNMERFLGIECLEGVLIRVARRWMTDQNAEYHSI